MESYLSLSQIVKIRKEDRIVIQKKFLKKKQKITEEKLPTRLKKKKKKKITSHSSYTTNYNFLTKTSLFPLDPLRPVSHLKPVILHHYPPKFGMVTNCWVCFKI